MPTAARAAATCSACSSPPCPPAPAPGGRRSLVVNSERGRRGPRRAPRLETRVERVRVSVGDCATGEPRSRARRTPTMGGAGGARGPVSSGATLSRIVCISSPGTPSSQTTSEQSPVTATSRPPSALDEGGAPGSTSGASRVSRRATACTVPFSKNTAANCVEPAMCVARASGHRSRPPRRAARGADHVAVLSGVRPSSIVGPRRETRQPPRRPRRRRRRRGPTRRRPAGSAAWAAAPSQAAAQHPRGWAPASSKSGRERGRAVRWPGARRASARRESPPGNPPPKPPARHGVDALARVRPWGWARGGACPGARAGREWARRRRRRRPATLRHGHDAPRPSLPRVSCCISAVGASAGAPARLRGRGHGAGGVRLGRGGQCQQPAARCAWAVSPPGSRPARRLRWPRAAGLQRRLDRRRRGGGANLSSDGSSRWARRVSAGRRAPVRGTRASPPRTWPPPARWART